MCRLKLLLALLARSSFHLHRSRAGSVPASGGSGGEQSCRRQLGCWQDSPGTGSFPHQDGIMLARHTTRPSRYGAAGLIAQVLPNVTEPHFSAQALFSPAPVPSTDAFHKCAKYTSSPFFIACQCCAPAPGEPVEMQSGRRGQQQGWARGAGGSHLACPQIGEPREQALVLHHGPT